MPPQNGTQYDRAAEHYGVVLTPVPDVRDQRPKGRPADCATAVGHYSQLLAEVRALESRVEHYQGLLDQLHAQLRGDAETLVDTMPVPVAAADYLPRGYVPRASDMDVF
jgi:hypothetical protein